MVAPSLIRKIIVWSSKFTELKQNYTFPELVQNRLQFELSHDAKVPLTSNRVHTDLSQSSFTYPVQCIVQAIYRVFADLNVSRDATKLTTVWFKTQY